MQMDRVFLANFEKGITTVTKKLKQRYGLLSKFALSKGKSLVKRKVVNHWL